MNLYSFTSITPQTKHLAIVFYKAYYFKYILKNSIHLDLLKIVRLTRPQTSKKRKTDSNVLDKDAQKKDPRFHSSHCPIGDAELDE